jgi:hypothetical protein
MTQNFFGWLNRDHPVCVNFLINISPFFIFYLHHMELLVIVFLLKTNIYVIFYYTVQSDQQESKSEQALQIIGHVVAKSYAHKRSKHGRRQFMVSNAT